MTLRHLSVVHPVAAERPAGAALYNWDTDQVRYLGKHNITRQGDDDSPGALIPHSFD